MNISLVNTFAKGGGAAIACLRLRKALEKEINFSLVSLPSGKINHWKHLFHLGLEKFPLNSVLKDKANRFVFDTNTQGLSLSKNPLIRNAEIIHLHWINQGLVSLEELRKLFSQNTPVVWTLHDMWTFTGGCHYSRGCIHYEGSCGNCHFLKNNSPNDLSHKIWEEKVKLFDTQKPYIVTCSNWLAVCARKSSLLKNCNIRVIPNPIDTDIFKPSDKNTLRKKLNLPPDKKLILFSSARLDDPRKGIDHLVNSLHILHQQHPELASSTELVLMGNVKQTLPSVPYHIHATGFVSGDVNLAEYYAACDIFVLPSTEDNLPNTVMEALACGTPAVAFNGGGLPDLIEHERTGYLATYKEEQDFANGIEYLLQNFNTLSGNCRKKTLMEFSEEVVGKKYLEVYKEAILNKTGIL